MTEKKNSPEGIELRYSDLSDGKYLKQWLLDPSVARWFPMFDEVEIDDAVARWIGFSRYKCSLTATKEGVPCGITTLYLQPYRKLAHQCEFGIIVAPEMRGQGVGTLLISNLSHMAKENFKIEVLHLQVYAENPAIHLYTRMGFREFGRQTHWIKEKDGFYVGRVFMERWL
ncbi:putative acetyltransferase [Neochlamydia sp. TUME1]|jgi:putative acetyltransferase|uniref:GNAT family N-acetyltransferase n=1 Tax=Neochlamydia sp. TUME1 TaxID=1478174 RepID=UPI00057E6C44|nr:GNAT family protein [Neochlamydia sp. TUME1]KIC72529.1 putative acetyltransferase [Neochlamydia sp. TUME1]